MAEQERRIVSLPERPTLKSQYDIEQGWNFEPEKASFHVRRLGQSLGQLLENPDIWVQEAYRVENSPNSERFNIQYVFYSSSREKPKFSRRELDLELRDLIKVNKRYEMFGHSYGTTTSSKGITYGSLDMNTSAISEINLQEYQIEKITLKKFNLYSRRKKSLEILESFFDPRRFVVEVRLEDPIIALRLQIADGLKNQGKINKYLQ